MDLELVKAAARELFQWNHLEVRRTPPREANPLSLNIFNLLEAQVRHDMKKPALTKTHTTGGQVLKKPLPMNRSLKDETLVHKLISMRNKIPLSTRILRPEGPKQ